MQNIDESKISAALALLEEAVQEKKEEIKQILEKRYSRLQTIIVESFRRIPPSSQRVPLHTSKRAQNKIWLETVENVAAYVTADRAAINRRLIELEYEWDIERVIQTNAASLALAGTLFSLKNRRWIILPLAVTFFLLQHAVQGWCPPIPFLRNLGVRTRREIDNERNALKRIRGDFGDFRPLDNNPRGTAVELLNTQNA